MTIKSGVIEGFEGYSQFSSLEEFNHHLEMWLAVHKHDFSKGELVGLKRLSRFAAKIPGVSNAKIGTVLKAIHEEYNELGISRSTFKRMIIKASNLGIFTVYETERKNGSQSSNLYVFNRFPINEPPEKEKMNHHIKTINPSETKTIKNNKREETSLQQAPEDHLFVSDRIPKPFVDMARYFFPSAKAIEEFWKMTTIAAYKNNQENEPDSILSVSLDSFNQLVRKMKSNVTVKNPLAYYTGILNKKFQEIYFSDLFEMEF
ncbi:hypothetical protein G3A_06260 [Bacillus sp. 17376]|uniref:Phage protein n=1 Tax=Mesobacillus boroniphilus JCM 21738 TaxID=1294265 RepID=W4RTA5_9BACI|nr:hypothetical protein [Mesobacillus boroniphilus]ESU33426.1 hypothetical protein G3A_06260 [Bacillus sp. 17376]GAE47337.1 phage protein [Mesobacillus boroniphilus JCM 21738]